LSYHLQQPKTNQSPHNWRQNAFGHQTCDDQKKFSHHTISDGMLSIAKLAVTKNIPLPIMWQLFFSQLPHIFGSWSSN